MVKKIQELCNIFSKLKLSGIYFLCLQKLDKLKLLRGSISIRVPGIKHKIFLRTRTSDIKLFRNIFIEQEYNISLPFVPNTIIDGGANIGLATILFANKYPAARIISIEPESSNFEQLKKNTSLYPNITLIKGGIWRCSSYLNITNPNSSKWSFITTEIDQPNETSIQGLSLDDIISNAGWENADMIKLDIEGSEKEVFDQSGEWLQKVKVLIVELHDWFKPGSSSSVFRAVNNYNFTTSQSGENTVFIRS